MDYKGCCSAPPNRCRGTQHPTWTIK
jgi:hypothetical protein